MIASQGLAESLQRALPSASKNAIDALAKDLASRVVEVANAPKPPHLTLAQARLQATKISDLASKLGQEIDKSDVARQLGMVGRIVNGGAGLDDEGLLQLRVLLSALRRDAQALLLATGGNLQVPQVELPGRGDRSGAAARGVASVVLWELHMQGVAITATERGSAVGCVAAALALASIAADARHCVRVWIERHPSDN